MRATAHASYCTDHVADLYDPDDKTVVSEGFCRDPEGPPWLFGIRLCWLCRLVAAARLGGAA